MKKLSLLFISLFLVLSACTQPTDSDTVISENTETKTENIPDTWEEFNGYAIDSKTENNFKKILVVKGITQDEVVNKSVEEVMKKVPSKDMIWFTDKQISLEKIQIGDQVSVWWDARKLHPEPAVLTLPAENIEIDN